MKQWKIEDTSLNVFTENWFTPWNQQRFYNESFKFISFLIKNRKIVEPFQLIHLNSELIWLKKIMGPNTLILTFNFTTNI